MLNLLRLKNSLNIILRIKGVSSIDFRRLLVSIDPGFF
jgi:hypothetical protein